MKLNKDKLFFFNYIALLSLSLLAALIYFLYRDGSILFNQIFSTFGFDGIQEKQRIQELLPMPAWIIYSVPGGIWVYVTSVIASKFEKTSVIMYISIFSVPTIYAVGLEFCQLFQLTDGTFDWVDLLFILLGVFFAKHSEQLDLNLNKHPKIQNFALISAFLVLLLSDVHH
jgi:hypothetical protein